jgi:hypothetical protein
MAVNYFQDRSKLIKEFLRPGRGQERQEKAGREERRTADREEYAGRRNEGLEQGRI